jgi:hypothetical protein
MVPLRGFHKGVWFVGNQQRSYKGRFFQQLRSTVWWQQTFPSSNLVFHLDDNQLELVSHEGSGHGFDHKVVPMHFQPNPTAYSARLCHILETYWVPKFKARQLIRHSAPQ